MNTYEVKFSDGRKQTIKADGVEFNDYYVVFIKWINRGLWKKSYREIVVAFNQDTWYEIKRVE